MSNIKNVAVIGTGVIGTGWIIRLLAHNKIVYAFDKDIKSKKKLIEEIKRAWPYTKKLFNKKKLNLKNFKYFTSLKETLKNADFVQECATENYSLKLIYLVKSENIQNKIPLFHLAHQDCFLQEFIQNARILKEEL